MSVLMLFPWLLGGGMMERMAGRREHSSALFCGFGGHGAVGMTLRVQGCGVCLLSVSQDVCRL